MKKAWYPVFTVLALLTSASFAQPPADTPRKPLDRPAVPAGTSIHRDLEYVPRGHPRQRLDLYLPPDAKNPPLIILIHGGAFKFGSKEGENPAPFLAQGYAVASLNYRLSGDAVFPAQIEDCKAAVRWLRVQAGRYGYNPDRFGAWGSSAGGHLVAMLGTAGGVKKYEVGQNLAVSSRVQAVVDNYGPTDFLQMDAHRLPGGMDHGGLGSPESELIGGKLQDNLEKVRNASPITYVTKECPPFLVIHGDRDPLVPHHQSELLVAALQKAGVPVTFHTVRGGGHGGFTDPAVQPMTDAFFAKHLKSAE